MPAIRDDQLEALRDALVDAYPRLDDLRQLTDHGLGFDFDVEVQAGGQGGTRSLAWQLIKWVKKHGAVDPLFEAALKRRPGNEAMQKFAASIGRATVRGTERALQASSFDLEDLEGHCSDLLEGQLSRGLRVLVIAGVEPNVFDCVTERLCPLVHRRPDSRQPDKDISLDPLVANIDKEIGRVTGLRDKTAQRHVLVKLHAAELPSADLAKFFGGVRAGLPAQLVHDLVLLVRAAAALNPPLPDGLADLQLPQPAFAAKHLYRWVDRVSNGQGWNEALMTEFKGALVAIARLQQGPSTGDFYDAVTEAIECLRGNPDEAALRAWIAEQHARYPSPGARP